jgi:ABC-type maltose transport system permease subunit
MRPTTRRVVVALASTVAFSPVVFGLTLLAGATTTQAIRFAAVWTLYMVPIWFLFLDVGPRVQAAWRRSRESD